MKILPNTYILIEDKENLTKQATELIIKLRQSFSVVKYSCKGETFYLLVQVIFVGFKIKQNTFN